MPGRGSVGGALRRVAGAWLAAVLAVQAHAQEAPAAATQPAFEQILVAGEYRYARSRRAGVHVSFDQGHTWQARSTGLPHRIVYPFPDPPEFATVTSLAVDPANPRRLAATTASAVFVSSNGGMAWQPVATEQVHPHAYFTSVALAPHDPAGMLLGTSFHGVYETTDGGANWHHLTPAIRFLTERNLYYEEVAGLSYDPAAPRAMVVLAGFDGGVFYVSDRFGEERRSGTGLLRYPVPAMATIQIGYAATGDGWELHAGTVDARWRLTADGTWSPIGAATPLRRGVPLQLPPPAPAPLAIEAAPAADPPPEAAPASGQSSASAPAADPPPETAPDSGQSDAPAPAADPALETAPDPGQSDAPAPAADPPPETAPDPGQSDAPAPAADPPPETAPHSGQSGAPAPTADPPPETAPDSGQSGAPAPAADPPPETAPDSGQSGAPAPAADPPPETAPDSGQSGAPAPAADPDPQTAPDSDSPRQPATDAGQSEAPAPDSGQSASPAAAAGSSGQSAPASGPSTPAAPATEAPAQTAPGGQPGTPAPDSGAAKIAEFASGLPQAAPPDAAAGQTPAGQNLAQPTSAGQSTAHQAPATRPGAARSPTVRSPGEQPATAQTPAADTAAEQPAAAQPGATPPQPALAAGEPGWIPGPGGMATAAPHTQAALRNGIYVRADRAAAALPEYLELLNRHGLDSLVIDFKTDIGSLSYDSDLPLARAMGAAPGPIKLDRLIAEAHAAGIYVIARLVVFKDPYLYDWDNHRLAIWDGELDEPWRHLVPAGGDDPDAKVQREYWVDPYAPEVWQYNVDVAVELASRGVDEIQFDYIRFPSDGPVERARYRHRRPGQQRIDAIESLLALARERLEVPISTDLFGFNSWYRAGNFIGQDIDVLSEYADVISPMFYPSHFPGHFMTDRSYTERAYAIYETGVRRAQRLVRGRAHIRPYVQAFLIGRELRMEEDEYSRYLTRQLDGNRAAAGSGFTLWNASNRYYMVTEPLQPYFDTRGEETP